MLILDSVINTTAGATEQLSLGEVCEEVRCGEQAHLIRHGGEEFIFSCSDAHARIIYADGSYLEFEGDDHARILYERTTIARVRAALNS